MNRVALVSIVYHKPAVTLQPQPRLVISGDIAGTDPGLSSPCELDQRCCEGTSELFHLKVLLMIC